MYNFWDVKVEESVKILWCKSRGKCQVFWSVKFKKKDKFLVKIQEKMLIFGGVRFWNIVKVWQSFGNVKILEV